MNRFAFLMVVVCGCTVAAKQPATQAEREGLEKAMDTPTTFTVPADEADQAWSRAQVFVSKYAGMKIQNATDSLVETYNPTHDGVSERYAYKITRLDQGENVRIEVECFSGKSYDREQKDQNAHIAAHYIKTGEMACESCIRQVGHGYFSTQ